MAAIDDVLLYVVFLIELINKMTGQNPFRTLLTLKFKQYQFSYIPSPTMIKLIAVELMQQERNLLRSLYAELKFKQRNAVVIHSAFKLAMKAIRSLLRKRLAHFYLEAA